MFGLLKLALGALSFLVIIVGISSAEEFNINTANCSLERSFANEVGKRLDSDVLKKFHAILMDNELSGGCGALQFTDAKMDSHTNGFSFGLSQFDLATRSASLDVLKTIVHCARDEGIRKISANDIAFLERHGRTPTFKLKNDAETWRRFATLRGPIEETLRSQCGRASIANSYIAEMKAFERRVEPLWTAVLRSNPEQKKAELFYKLYALDLLNVLGGADGFKKVVAGEAPFACFKLCAQKITELYKLDGPVSVSDFIRYPFQATCYGFVPAQTRQQDALRRLNRVLAEVDLASLPLDEDDIQYLKTDFAVILARNSARFPNSVTGNLKMLTERATSGTMISAEPLDEALIAKSVDTCKPSS